MEMYKKSFKKRFQVGAYIIFFLGIINFFYPLFFLQGNKELGVSIMVIGVVSMVIAVVLFKHFSTLSLRVCTNNGVTMVVIEGDYWMSCEVSNRTLDVLRVRTIPSPQLYILFSTVPRQGMYSMEQLNVLTEGCFVEECKMFVPHEAHPHRALTFDQMWIEIHGKTSTPPEITEPISCRT